MAELLVIGPLVNVGIFLTTWAVNKWKSNRLRRDTRRETDDLASAVNTLGAFMQEKATVIADFERIFEIRPSSLGIVRLGYSLY